MLGIYRTLHMTSFCGNATSMRSELLDRIVKLVEEPSKIFPVVEARRSRNIRKYTPHIAEIITELEIQDDRRNRWIQSAESNYNNCVNDKPFSIEFSDGQGLMEQFPRNLNSPWLTISMRLNLKNHAGHAGTVQGNYTPIPRT